MRPAGKTMSAALVGLLAGCTTPDLGPSVQDAQTLLDAAAKSTAKPLEAQARRELAQSEAALAETDGRIVSLSPGCLQRLNTDLALSVDQCRVVEHAKPLAGAVNATQVLFAQTVMRDYFAALSELTLAKSPAEIRANANALGAAIQDVSKSRDSAGLARLATKARARGPAVAAVLGFAAEQARAAAMRRTVRQADPVFEELVRGIQPILLDLGDPIADRRAQVVDSFADYETARQSNNPRAAVAAARALKDSMNAMHAAEATSAIRQLYLVRDLHASMLTSLTSPSLDELEALSAQISEIKTLLEAS